MYNASPTPEKRRRDFLLDARYMDQYSLGDSDDQIRLRGAWEQVLRRFQPEVSPAWYERFLRPLRPTSLEEGVATMAAPGRFVYEWVRERYAKKLEEALTD